MAEAFIHRRNGPSDKSTIVCVISAFGILGVMMSCGAQLLLAAKYPPPSSPPPTPAPSPPPPLPPLPTSAS